jgi:hypothetical protein
MPSKQGHIAYPRLSWGYCAGVNLLSTLTTCGSKTSTSLIIHFVLLGNIYSYSQVNMDFWLQGALDLYVLWRVIPVRYPIDARSRLPTPTVGVTNFTRDPVKEDPDLVSYQKAQLIATWYALKFHPFTQAHALKLIYRLLNWRISKEGSYKAEHPLVTFNDSLLSL